MNNLKGHLLLASLLGLPSITFSVIVQICLVVAKTNGAITLPWWIIWIPSYVSIPMALFGGLFALGITKELKNNNFI